MELSKSVKLNNLLEKRKFADSEWEKRGLNPSNYELCENLEQNLNKCLNSLLNQIENKSSEKELKKTLKINLKAFNKSSFDTEEKEFICDYYNEISKIIEIDFKNELNNWLYGSLLNTLFKVTEFIRGKEKVIEILSQNCTKCEAKLETFIFKKDENIPKSDFFIVRCNSCENYNLIDIGPKIKSLKFGEYELTEQLSREDFNLEQAKIRLNQIQFFRK